MIDGKVLLIALMALCGANLALIWQVSKLTDKMNDMHASMHATERRIARELDSAHVSKEYQFRVFGQKDVGDDGDED